ncbi:MAG: type III pantothenate kinase [Bernardetiaceae bacterium]|jgi:type III pantothenate kinase|nr:type III pantothenate kinase [Bernardetiaceae bacterium]
MNLAIDRGNTFAKVGAFVGREPRFYYERLTDPDLFALVRTLVPARVIVSDVRGDMAAQLRQQAEADGQRLPVLEMKPELPVPLHNDYLTPHTLGMDRLAAAIGAAALFPATHLLVMDAGTCITYDLVEASGTFLGGSIAPGLKMRFKAMHHFTARLPLLEPAPEPIALTGRSTAEAMQSGAVLGLVAEIEGFIAHYQQLYPNLQPIITGGDAPYLAKRAKPAIFASQTLVVQGLNEVLLFNTN